MPLPNFRWCCFFKKIAKFLSPRHCEKVDVASLTPQALALGIFQLQQSQELTSNAAVKAPNRILSSVPSSKSALPVAIQFVLFIAV